MNTMSPISAVIVTHNSAATIEACLRSILAAGCQPIVVVDNNSTDATHTATAGGPVQLLHNDRNLGFGAACNQGVGQVASPYVMLLNPDAVLDATALPQAYEYLAARPTLGAVGLCLCDAAGVPERDTFGNTVTPWSLVTRKFRRRKKISAPQRCDWVSGGAMLVRREAFVAVGGFDEQFFMYWEDVDLCHRLRAAGWQIAFFPRAKVIHRRGGSFSRRDEQTAYYDQSADRYFQKHYSTMICRLHRFWRRLYRFLVPLAR